MKRTANLVAGFLYNIFRPCLRNGLQRLWQSAGLHRTIQSNTDAKGAALILLIHRLTTPLQIAYVSDFFYLITLWCSKCSMSLVFIRLSPDKGHGQMAKAILVAATIWLIVSFIMIALRCDLSHPWNFVDMRCTNVVRVYVPFSKSIDLRMGFKVANSMGFYTYRSSAGKSSVLLTSLSKLLCSACPYCSSKTCKRT